MKELCFDEAVLQAYADGELSPETMQSVAAHINTCAACAAVAKEIESENELMMNALAPEMALSVPTENLRARIERAIQAEQLSEHAKEVEKKSRVRAWLAGLIPSFNFSPQQAVGFASLIAVITFAAIFAAVKLQHKTTSESVAINRPTPPPAVTNSSPSTSNDSPVEGVTKPTVSPAPKSDERLQREQLQQASGGRWWRRKPSGSMPSAVAGNNVKPATPLPEPPPLPDEQGYLKAIASLTRAIDSTGGNSTLPAGVQAEYRRNLELIDQAIAATRVAARRNPQDASARQFLYASYQNKVDLLSAVADQTMLVASR